jgi:hypothetical protein
MLFADISPCKGLRRRCANIPPARRLSFYPPHPGQSRGFGFPVPPTHPPPQGGLRFSYLRSRLRFKSLIISLCLSPPRYPGCNVSKPVRRIHLLSAATAGRTR